MPDELEVKWLRSTPERRAAVFQIKLLFDEAHRLGEGYDLNAYADQIAQIETAMAEVDPDTNKDDAHQCAAIVRRRGTDAGRAWLDARLSSLGERFIHFENILRIGFEMEMTDVYGDNHYY